MSDRCVTKVYFKLSIPLFSLFFFFFVRRRSQACVQYGRRGLVHSEWLKRPTTHLAIFHPNSGQKKKKEQKHMDMKNEKAFEIERNKIMLRTYVGRDDGNTMADTQ